MSITYTNVPNNKPSSSSDQTIGVFNQYNSVPLELNSTSLTAMIGYLETRGFGAESAETISIAILQQAKADGYSPFTILETIKGLDNAELSGLVGEILNYNRLKTSTLGTVQQISPVDEVKRNILA